MGNEFHTASAIRHEIHTDAEEQPLTAKTAPSIRFQPVYYVDAKTENTYFSPRNTLTTIHPKRNNKPNADHFPQVILHNESNKTNQLSDCWDIVNPNRNEYIAFDETFDNTIQLRSSAKHNKQWISCFGTKIVTKGEYKRWQIKILSNDSKSKKYMHKIGNNTAKLMIGIADIDSLSDKERGNAIHSEFWRLPHFGYGFNGENGKKYHIAKNGASYANKYKVGDTITVELNRTRNTFIMHNDLRFYTNEKVDGMAFNVDHDRNYVLAIAMCSDKYRIQISDC